MEQFQQFRRSTCTKKCFACQSLNKILTVVSKLIFIKPKIRKSADLFGVRRHIRRRTQLADVLGQYVGVYAQRIAPAPIGVNF